MLNEWWDREKQQQNNHDREDKLFCCYITIVAQQLMLQLQTPMYKYKD